MLKVARLFWAKNLLGIIVDVHLHQDSGKDLITITIPSYSVPISYKGKYYYRSGSTKKELTGQALTEFLLKKMGQTWDELPEGMTLDMLKRHHPSRPRNPLLASACFKAGYIDSWGRGILQIIKYSRSYGLLAPEFREYAGGFEVFLRKYTPQVTPQVGQLLEALKEGHIEMTIPDKPNSRLQKYRKAKQR